MSPRSNGSPKHAVPTQKGRYYVDPADPKVRLLSVTNALSTAIGKPALISWAARTVAEEAVDRVVALVKRSRTDPAGAVKWLAGSPYAKRDAAAKLGSDVHGVAERHALGVDIGEQPADVLAMVEQYLAFRADYQPTYEATELTVAHRGLRYAGTLDAVVVLPDGRRLCIDYKTSSTRDVASCYPEFALQLAAYRYAETGWLDDGTEVKVPEVDGCAVLNLRPNGYALIEVDAGPATFAAFCHALALAQWLLEVGDKSIGGRVALPAPVDEKASA